MGAVANFIPGSAATLFSVLGALALSARATDRQRKSEPVRESADVCRVGTVDFVITTFDQAVEQTLSDAVSRRTQHVHFANAWSVALAESDTELSRVFNSGRSYPDGRPVVWAMHWLRAGLGEQRARCIQGPVFFEEALEQGVPLGIRHYFLGSTPETLKKLEANVSRSYPGIKIVGTSSPPFRDLTSVDLGHELAKIADCAPHIVWVGLGTPKQDKVAAFLAANSSVVFACVGAAFDFTAGNLRVAPSWIQVRGLGWMYRFLQEPRRLWRRYTYGNAKFIRIALVQLAMSRLVKWRNRNSKS